MDKKATPKTFPFKTLFAVAIIAFSMLNVGKLTSQTTTAFRKNYNQALFDLPGNITEALTPTNYVLAGTNLNFLPIYGTVSQLNDTGGVVWSNRYSDASIGFQLNDIKKDAGSSQYYTCGGSESNAAVFMVLDASGNIVLSKKFIINEANTAWFNRVIKVADGGYVAVGYVTGYDPDGAGPEIKYDPITYTDANGDSQTDYIGSPLIVKLDASGNHVWHKVFRYYIAATKNPATERIYNDASFTDIVEVSDGYVAVGSYDVNQHLSATNSDGDDATPTDALILKTTTAGVITFHKQIDNPNTSTSQTSKYLAAINTTSTGSFIVGGSDNSKELIQKFAGPGAFSNTFSRLFTYSTSFFGTVTDPADVSQIYEVNGGTDLITMSMYIKPLSFFSNAIHRVNSTATSNVWTKHYDFNLISILPRGGKVSDNGYISLSMTAGGTNYDYHVIKTDPSGDTPLSGCPPTSFSPAAAAGPTTFADPYYNSWSGTPGSDVIAISKTSITLTPAFVCTKVACIPPAAATTVTATPNPICAGQTTVITASGPATGVTYNVYAAASGGASLGSTPFTTPALSGTTSYYIETANNSDPTCVSTTRTIVTVTVNSAPSATIAYSGAFCQTAGVQAVTQTGTTGGSYSATPAGLSINAATGAVTPSTSAVNTYTVTYTIAAAAPCPLYTTTATVQIVSAPTATFSYAGTPFCSSASAQTPTFSGTTGGTYSALPAGLSINSVTGEITPGTSSAGTYTVTYSIAAGGGCSAYSTTTSVTITTAPAATISYSGGAFCASASPENVSQTGTTGGTYSATPAGLSLNTVTGQITPGTSTANTYTVTYTIAAAAPCPLFSTTTTVQIISAPTATISYAGTPFCTSASPQTPAFSGTIGGTYSALPAGLSINPATGEITPGTSSAGTYTVTYSIAASGGCPAYSTTTSVTITTAPAATISYSAGSFCANAAPENVLQTGTTGGPYSATPAGLSINTATGQITPSSSTANIYTVTYTIAASGGCPLFTTTTGVTINPVTTPVTGFSYASPVCINGTNPAPTPVAGFTTGGIYSSTAGLTINSSTGVIDLSTSISGTYTVTYTVAAIGCASAGSSNTSIVITSVITPVTGFSYASPVCMNGTNPVPIPAAGFTTGGTYSSTAGLTINSSTGVITLSSTTPGTYTVTYSITASGCTLAGNSTSTITINPSITPVTGFSYTTPVCANGTNPVPIPAAGFTTGGSYSSTAGLTMNPSTGAINLSTSTPGTYTVTYSLAASGCTLAGSSSATITITPVTTPITGFSYTSPVCVNGTNPVPIPVTSFVTGGTYSSTAGVTINPSTGVITLSTSTPGTYTVTYTVAAAGCVLAGSSTATITISPIVTPVTGFSYNTPYCVGGTNPTPLPVTNFTSGGVYSSTSGLSINSSTGVVDLTTSTPGTYTVTYTYAASGCTLAGSSNSSITIAPIPVASAGPDITITQFTQDTLSASGGGTYQWTPSTGLSCDTCANPIADPSSTTVYCVTVTNASGCSDSACVTVTVDIVCGDLFVPTAFSPNGDGQNDILYVKSNCIVDMDFAIFDRWGEKVFETNDVNIGWDGTVKGKPLDTAVFAYYLKGTIKGNVIDLHGNITLTK